MPRHYKQSHADRRDESLGMRRGKESGKSQSYKSRRDESHGMKKSMSKGAGHAHREVHREHRHNEPMHYGSSNHGHGGSGPPLGDRMHAQQVAQKIDDWSCDCSNAMRQHENGSMDYLSDKNEIRREDDRRISHYMLPQ